MEGCVEESRLDKHRVEQISGHASWTRGHDGSFRRRRNLRIVRSSITAWGVAWRDFFTSLHHSGQILVLIKLGDHSGKLYGPTSPSLSSRWVWEIRTEHF